MTYMVIYLTGSPIVQYQKEEKLAANQKFHHKGKLLVGCGGSSRGEPVESIALYIHCILQQLNITETVPFSNERSLFS